MIGAMSDVHDLLGDAGAWREPLARLRPWRRQGRDEPMAFGITHNRAWTGTREPARVRAHGLTTLDAITRALEGNRRLSRITVTGPLAGLRPVNGHPRSV
jgi:hypothetical protein